MFYKNDRKSLFYRIFKLKPTNGILKNEFQLVVIQMVPKDARIYNQIVKYQLNSTASVYAKVINVHDNIELLLSFSIELVIAWFWRISKDYIGK